MDRGAGIKQGQKSPLVMRTRRESLRAWRLARSRGIRGVSRRAQRPKLGLNRHGSTDNETQKRRSGHFELPDHRGFRRQRLGRLLSQRWLRA